MKNIQLVVKGMSCGHCVNSIEDALQELGVKGKVDLANEKVAVEFDENIFSIDKIKEVIEEQGYDV
ncbi:MAG: cation transporter [Candidatus Pristimantibacillus lignocellulolyticus]|uniref:Cation transporter n=1 Tax=Candidatus Pristimantibacillus lignocellulolyticus TaxID=2994561 RepID=A0A9J6Z9A5_9BACL|nr:MAG: cation transporter [Candidatus Pristimantibacillus lignocellulolyticus]